jgi:hypothetical protein
MNKILVALIALSMLFMSPPYDRLDITRDGKVTLTDLVCANQLKNDIIERLKGG